MAVRWYPQQFQAKVDRQLQQNLDRAANVLASDIKGSFGHSGVTGTRSGGGMKLGAAHRSQPWGPPNVVTEYLKRNIGYDKPVGRPLIRRVGTGIGNKESVGYAMWLEFGTRKMLPRPYLRPMLWKDRDKIKQILSTPAR